VGPRTGLDEVERRKFLTLPGLEPRPLGRPARSQSLYQLSYPGSLYIRFKINHDVKYRTGVSVVILVSVVIVAVLLKEDLALREERIMELQVNSDYCGQMVSLSGCVRQLTAQTHTHTNSVCCRVYSSDNFVRKALPPLRLRLLIYHLPYSCK
jgi:hypothetical protein